MYDAIPSRRTTTSLLGAGLGLLGLLLVVWTAVKTANPLSFNHDVAWTLHAAETLYRGGAIPGDLFDTNPPLVYWLSVPLIAAAEATGLRPIAMMNAAVHALAFTSTAALWFLLRRVAAWRREEALTAAALAMVGFIPLADHDFGQRDHLVVVLLLPYLVATALAAAGRTTPRGLRAVTAAAVALAVALKPYYGVVWLAAEAYLAVARPPASSPPWRRLENPIIVALGAAYLVAVALVAPGWFEVMALTIELYGAYAGGFVWLDTPLLLLIALTAAGALLTSGRAAAGGLPADQRHPIRLALLSAWLFFGVAAFQDMGFSYHLLPTYIMALLTSGLLGLALLSRAPGSAHVRLLPAVMAGLVALSVAAIYQEHRSAAEADETARVRLVRLLADHPARGGVLALTTSVFPTFPVVNLAGRRSVSRFSCLWLLPGILADPGAREASEAYFREAVIEDMAAAPAFILEDRGVLKQAVTGPFDLLDYFRQDPRFRARFEGYEHLADVEGYRVWVRREPEG